MAVGFLGDQRHPAETAMSHRLRLLAVLVTCMLLGGPVAHAADDPPAKPRDMGVPTTTGEGVKTTGAAEPTVRRLGGGKDLNGNPFATPMVFQVRIACESNIAANPDPAACQRAAASCQTSTGIIGIGFLYEI